MNGLQVAAGPVLLCLIAWLCFAGRTKVVAGGPITDRAFRKPQLASIIAVAKVLPEGWRIVPRGDHALITATTPGVPVYLMAITADDMPCMIRVTTHYGKVIIFESVDAITPADVVTLIVHHSRYAPIPTTETPHHDENI